jgi:hypothetical protein
MGKNKFLFFFVGQTDSQTRPDPRREPHPPWLSLSVSLPVGPGAIVANQPTTTSLHGPTCRGFLPPNPLPCTRAHRQKTIAASPSYRSCWSAPLPVHVSSCRRVPSRARVVSSPCYARMHVITPMAAELPRCPRMGCSPTRPHSTTPSAE